MENDFGGTAWTRTLPEEELLWLMTLVVRCGPRRFLKKSYCGYVWWEKELIPLLSPSVEGNLLDLTQGYASNEGYGEVINCGMTLGEE